MKNKTLMIITTLIIAACGAWLFMLYNGGANEFEQTYTSFGNNIPGITLLLLSSINYWWAILSVIAVTSYLPLLLPGKLKYLSLFIASASLGLLVIAIYLPIYQIGQAI